MDTDNPERPHPSRPNKRAKTSSTMNVQNVTQKSARATRKRPSKLANLLGMPIDILFEIFGHLHPYDLLKLSRTTKDFRQLLTRKSSISVWKDSLSNVPGLPECPPGMCEIAWANLVFSPHCHFCLSTGTRSIEWRFRFRICSKCAKEHFEPIVFGVHGIFELELLLEFESMLIHRNDKRRTLFLKSDFDTLLEEYNSISDSTLRKDYVSNRQQSIEVICEHARRCQDWEQNQVQDREFELRQLREDRIAAIKEKLIGLGWEKDLASMRYIDSLFNNKLANRPQRLTERIWNNIKPGILEHMEKVRVLRLKREYDKQVSERRALSLQILRDFKRSKLTKNLILPKPPDFYEFPPVKEITEMPADVEIAVSSFDNVILQIPELVNNWRNQLEYALVKVLKRDADSSDNENNKGLFPDTVFPCANLSEEEFLRKAKLACTVYECLACTSSDSDDGWEDFSYFRVEEPYSKPLFYPHVLGHQCQRDRAYLQWYWDFDRLDIPEETTIRKLERIAIDITTGKCAESVITLAGLDPATATADDMDNLDLRFVCNKCWRPTNGPSFMPPKFGADGKMEEDCLRYLFDWRTAVRHLRDMHSHSTEQIYTKMRKDKLNNAILSEESECRLQNNCEWRCIHCIDFQFKNLPVSFQQMKSHFQSKHSDLPPPVINESCFRDFAAPNIHCIQPIFFVHSKNGHYSVHATDPDGQEYSNRDSDADNNMQ